MADLEILDPGQEASDEFVEHDDLDSAEAKLDAVVDQIHVSAVLLDQLGEDLEVRGKRGINYKDNNNSNYFEKF